MAENTSELPPFSFKKKPVSQYSSYTSTHSHISDILPSTSSNRSGSGDSSHASLAVSTTQPLDTCKEVDYDEQIRAPRMNNASFFSLGKKGDESMVSGGSNKRSNSGSSLSNEGDLEVEKKSSLTDNKYEPAIFDLSKPTRRFSAPTSSVNDYSQATILDYTNGNYIYQKDNDEHRELSKALDNLISNTSSQEKLRRVKNAVFKDKIQLSNNTSSIKQVYEPKKPLSTPAVLRPANENKGEIDNEQGTIIDESSSISMPNSEVLLDSLDDSKQLNKVHWKPNSFTDHCMRCFKSFGNFFSPMKRRRHHCRYCGFIFCSDCLIDNEQDIVLLDNDARFMIPIYKNLSSISFHELFLKNFKNVKICKKCFETYSKLINTLNLKNLKLPYVFIENPYVVKAEKEIERSNEINKEFKDEDLINEPPIIVDSKNRKSSINNVPTDWVWSSF